MRENQIGSDFVKDSRKAETIAYAEKKTRDLATDKDIEPDEKDILGKIADHKGDKAGAEYDIRQAETEKLVNPDLKILEDDIEKARSIIRELLGSPNSLCSYQRDQASGELTELKISIFEGIDSKLAPILGNLISIDREAKGDGYYLLQAYRTMPEVKVIIDEAIGARELIKESEKKINEIRKEKETKYENGTAVNEFFRRVGWDKKINDNFFKQIKESLRAIPLNPEGEDLTALLICARKLKQEIDAVAGLSVTEDQYDDFGMDLDIIQRKFYNVIYNGGNREEGLFGKFQYGASSYQKSWPVVKQILDSKPEIDENRNWLFSVKKEKPNTNDHDFLG